MKFGLSDVHLQMIGGELKKAGVTNAKIFGSRAKGNFRQNSDIDIAIWGSNINLGALLSSLDDLPTPYMFDIAPYDAISYQPLKDTILTVLALKYGKRDHGLTV